MAGRGKKKRGGCGWRVILLLILVAGGLIGYLSLTKSSPEQLLNQAQGWLSRVGQGGEDKRKIYSFAVLSDSHEDTTVFPEIVAQIAERDDLSFVAFLGDASNGGELEKLRQAKSYLDNIEVPVHVLPGDHDYNWVPQYDLSNFKQVFGLTKTSYSFSKGMEEYIFIDNSNGQNGLSDSEMDWVRSALRKAQQEKRHSYVFVSTPVYNPYLSFKSMGSQSEEVKRQADSLRELLSGGSVELVMAGDAHTFAEYVDNDYGVKMMTVGAAGVTKNLLPMYVVVDIFDDGSYTATSIPYDSNKIGGS